LVNDVVVSQQHTHAGKFRFKRRFGLNRDGSEVRVAEFLQAAKHQ
jgi:hypothetical protein